MTFKSQTSSSINFEGLQMKLIRQKKTLCEIRCLFLWQANVAYAPSGVERIKVR